MLHSKTRTNRIWTNEPVYWDFSVGNLDKTSVGETLRCPLQHGFDSDSQGSFTVAVHGHTALFTPIQGVISRLVPIVHCTAVRTPLGGVVSINKLERYTRLQAARGEEFSKPSVRNTVNLPVSLLDEFVFLSSDVKPFNGDRGIICPGKIHDFFSNLTA